MTSSLVLDANDNAREGSTRDGQEEYKDHLLGSEPRAWPGAISSSMRRRASSIDRNEES